MVGKDGCGDYTDGGEQTVEKEGTGTACRPEKLAAATRKRALAKAAKESEMTVSRRKS